MSAALAIVLAFGVLCGLIGAACASGRGRGQAGFWLGFFFGPLGWLIALFLPANERRYLDRRRGVRLERRPRARA